MAGYENALMSCNDQIFPICPECCETGFMDTGSHHLIVKMGDSYCLIHAPFSGACVFYVDSSTNYLVSQMGLFMWVLKDGAWELVGGLNYKTPICPMEGYVWSDMELHYSSNGLTAGKSAGLPWSAPVLYSNGGPALPVIDAFGWTDGGKDDELKQSDLVIPQLVAGGWTLLVFLKVIASVTDDGTLSCVWYRNGIEVAEGWELVPSATAIGKYTYYAVVTNTLNGESVSVTTPTITVEVIEYDFDNFDPDTGEDTTGTLTPDVVYPDSEGDDSGGDGGGDSGGDSGGDDTGDTNVIMHPTGSLMLGWILGRVIAGQRKHKEPQLVGYDYNGEILPAPPDENYQYVVVEYYDAKAIISGGRLARMICSSEPIMWYQQKTWMGDQGYWLLGDVKIYCFASHEEVWKYGFLEPESASLPLNEWVKIEDDNYDERTLAENYFFTMKVKCANHDIITDDGNVYTYKKPDPIPVYE